MESGIGIDIFNPIIFILLLTCTAHSVTWLKIKYKARLSQLGDNGASKLGFGLRDSAWGRRCTVISFAAISLIFAMQDTVLVSQDNS